MRSVQQIRENMVDLATVEMRRRFMQKRRYSLEEILKEMCDLFREDIERVKSPRRWGNLIRIRRLFSYVASEMTDFSLLEISYAMGGHEHSKASHLRDKARDFFSIQEEKFMSDWSFYTANSVIWCEYKAA